MRVNTIQHTVIVEYMKSYSEDIGSVNCTLAQQVPRLETLVKTENDKYAFWDAVAMHNATRVTELATTTFNIPNRKTKTMVVRSVTRIEARDAARRVTTQGFRTIKFETGLEIETLRVADAEAVLVCKGDEGSDIGGKEIGHKKFKIMSIATC